MIWQNPVAWVGLLALAVPLLIHLLSRHRARAQRFPSLRFVAVSRLTPTRRTRVSDMLLLLLRAGVIAAAVAALAQPLLETGDRDRNAGRTLARAVILDTSQSMRRLTPSGEPAADVARREAQRLSNESGVSLLIATHAPSRTLEGAAQWLGFQAGRRELVIVSDFQRGTLDDADLANVPADIGVRVARVAVAPVPDAAPSSARRAREPNRDTNVVRVLAGPDERAAAAAALRAAAAFGSLAGALDERRVAVVFSSYDGRENVLRAVRPLDQAWMGDAVARIRSDEVLAAVAVEGEVLDSVASATLAGTPHLVLYSAVSAGSLASAALIAAATDAVAPLPAIGELDPNVLDEQAVNRWQREPSTAFSRGSSESGMSDGRWLWLIVLALIAVETWMRRPR